MWELGALHLGKIALYLLLEGCYTIVGLDRKGTGNGIPRGMLHSFHSESRLMFASSIINKKISSNIHTASMTLDINALLVWCSGCEFMKDISYMPYNRV